MSALEPDDAVDVLGQPVDDLAFSLVAPLGADDDNVLCHGGSVFQLDVSSRTTTRQLAST